MEFLKQVYNSRLLSLYDVKVLPNADENDYLPISSANSTENNPSPLFSKHSVRLQYDSMDQFKKAAKLFGLMDDFKVF